MSRIEYQVGVTAYNKKKHTVQWRSDNLIAVDPRTTRNDFFSSLTTFAARARK